MKRIGVVLIVTVFSLVLLSKTNQSVAGFSFFGSHTKVKSSDGQILIPVADVDDGKAHYYQYETDEQVVKFFVLKSKDGVIRAAFDACDVCYHAQKGYSQKGDFVVCNNCGMRFHSTRINVVEGGCNPAPLKRKVVGDNLVIAVDDVIPGGRFF